MKEVVYYIHNMKKWYYKVEQDNSESKKVTHKCCDIGAYTEITDEKVITEKDCRAYIKNIYPEATLKKTVLYHEGPKRDKQSVKRKHDIKDKDRANAMDTDIKNYKA